MPFGKYEGKPLSEVPSDYLCWVFGGKERLSTGIHNALVAELERRGVKPPKPARPVRQPQCKDHPQGGFTCRWQTDSLGRKHIRAECAVCKRYLGFVPADVRGYIEMADLD
jgi:uncharacterized protein (DUF3820 family)